MLESLRTVGEVVSFPMVLFYDIFFVLPNELTVSSSSFRLLNNCTINKVISIHNDKTNYHIIYITPCCLSFTSPPPSLSQWIPQSFRLRFPRSRVRILVHPISNLNSRKIQSPPFLDQLGWFCCPSYSTSRHSALLSPGNRPSIPPPFLSLKLNGFPLLLSNLCSFHGLLYFNLILPTWLSLYLQKSRQNFTYQLQYREDR